MMDEENPALRNPMFDYHAGTMRILGRWARAEAAQGFDPGCTCEDCTFRFALMTDAAERRN